MENQSVTALLGLDWKLFLAQLFNFVIVLFVLWRWVFKPLGKKLEERTSKIELSIKHSEEVEQKLKEAEKYRQAEMEKVRAEANTAIAQAQKNAELVKQQILAEAKVSSDKMLEQAKKEIEGEKSRAMADIRTEAANLIVSATEKILREKLDPKRDEQLIKESLKDI
ncbi:MAG: atpF [Candidatus Doudnabacteria bacterium]|nr:atpF [Candidatus Doudnabacteria bacterium]